MTEAPLLKPPRAAGLRGWVAAAIVVLGIAFYVGTSATRLFRDSPTLTGPVAGTYELEAVNYCSGPRQRANGVPLDLPQRVYVVHTPVEALVFLGMATLDPGNVHRAVRYGTLALYTLFVLGTTLAVWRRRREVGPVGMAALLALWVLSPGLWNLARLAYSELFVGAGLVLALVTVPERGASLKRVAVGGLGTGVLVASKFYGVLPLFLFGAVLTWEDLRSRRAPLRAVAFGAGAAASAVALWGLVGLAYGFDPFAAVAEHVRGVGDYQDWNFHDGDAAQKSPPGLAARVVEHTLGIPRVLGAALPGWGWEWMVALLALRFLAARGDLSERRCLIWIAGLVVPYVLSPWAYRFWPLLVAAPFLFRPRTSPPAKPPALWPVLLLETLVLANVVRYAIPDQIWNRSRGIALGALVVAVGLHLLARTTRGRAASVAAARVAPRLLLAAAALVAVVGAGWQAVAWARPTWVYDGTARRLAARAPDDATVAGIILPELWCRYLPRSRAWPTDVAIRRMPYEVLLTSDVVIIPDPVRAGAYGEYLEGTEHFPEPIPFFGRADGRIVIGIRRPR